MSLKLEPALSARVLLASAVFKSSYKDRQIVDNFRRIVISKYEGLDAENGNSSAWTCGHEDNFLEAI